MTAPNTRVELPKGMTTEQAMAIRRGLKDLCARYGVEEVDALKRLRFWFEDLRGFPVSALEEGFRQAGAELMKFPAAPSWVRKYVVLAQDAQRARGRRIHSAGDTDALCSACGSTVLVEVPTPIGATRKLIQHRPGCRVASVVAEQVPAPDGRVSVQYHRLRED